MVKKTSVYLGKKKIKDKLVFDSTFSEKMRIVKKTSVYLGKKKLRINWFLIALFLKKCVLSKKPVFIWKKSIYKAEKYPKMFEYFPYS